MKRRISSLLIIILFVQIFNGCNLSRTASSISESKNQNIQIGISVYDQYDTFIASITSNFSRAVREKEKEENVTIHVDMVSADGSQLTQNDQIEQFIAQDYDLICVNLVDRTDPSMIIDKVKKADIPTIFFNRELVEEDLERWDQLYYVGAIALESGIMQGEIVKKICEKNFSIIDKNQDGKIQYVMLEGEFGHQDTLLRTEYVIETITDGGYMVERLGDEVANWNRSQAETKMSMWLEEFSGRIEAVFANNDEMALGAIDAMNENKIENEVRPLVLGIDGTQEALDAIERGELTGTVLNDAKGQAESMLELAYSIVADKELNSDIDLQEGKYIRLPHKIVMEENLEEIKKSRLL